MSTIVQKRQIITLIILIILLVLSPIFNIPYVIIELIFMLILLISFMTFVPCLSIIKIPQIIRSHIYCIPAFLPLLLVDLNKDMFLISLKIIILGLIGGLISIGLYYKDFKLYISNENIAVKMPLDKKEYIFGLYLSVLSLFGEEIYFRLYYTSLLKDYNSVFIVIISSIIFTYSHYMNRWAKNDFAIKNYIQHFSVGVICSILFIITHSIFACIIAHLIFNIPDAIVQYKRLNFKEESLFDDYN